MACLNSVDLIATPGRRFTRIFAASTGAALRTALSECLQTIGWTVERADNLGSVGYKATSAASPWCASGEAPVEYKGKCRVWFRREFAGPAAFAELTGFLVMNSEETPALTQTVTGITLHPTVNDSFGNYVKYSYMFVGTPYDFKLFMLGVQDRVNLGVSNERTAVFAGVPQIPGFLQARGSWCQHGINEMFYAVDASGMRIAGAYHDQKYFAGGISSAVGGTFLNLAQAGGVPENRYGWFLSYGTDGGNGASQALNSGYWVFDTLLTPPNAVAEIWPSIIVWPSDPANATTTKRMKGFWWDTVVLNKAFPGDALLRLDDKVFVVFNNNWAGAASPFRPPASMLIRVS